MPGSTRKSSGTKVSPEGLCKKCRRGYMVAEEVSSTKEIIYYCNNCFKYADTSKKGSAAKKALLKEAERRFYLWSDDDLDAYIDSLFDWGVFNERSSGKS